MPVYMLHGFRWPRPLIRIHIILQNLDDAAAEWLVAPDTTACLLENFQELHPDIMEHLPSLRFIEQYDPDDLAAGSGSQPYAYIADIVHEIKLGLDIDEVRGKGVSNEQWGSILELRDKLAPEEKVGWFVVNCGDEERWAPEPEEEESVNGNYATNGNTHTNTYTNNYNNHSPEVPYSPPTKTLPLRDRTASDSRSMRSTQTSSTDTRKDFSSPEVPQKGFKKFIGLVRRKSRASIREIHTSDSNNSEFMPPPPVPALPRGMTRS